MSIRVIRRKRRQSPIKIPSTLATMVGFIDNINPGSPDPGKTTIELIIEGANVAVNVTDTAELNRCSLYDETTASWGDCIAAAVSAVDASGTTVSLQFNVELDVSLKCRLYIPQDWPAVGNAQGGAIGGARDSYIDGGRPAQARKGCIIMTNGLG